MASTVVIDRRLRPARSKWQHEPRSHLGAAMVVFFSYPVCDLLIGAAALHGDHVAQKQQRDFGGNQPMVGISSERWRTMLNC